MHSDWQNQGRRQERPPPGPMFSASCSFFGTIDQNNSSAPLVWEILDARLIPFGVPSSTVFYSSVAPGSFLSFKARSHCAFFF